MNHLYESQSTMGVKVTLHKKGKQFSKTHLVPSDILRNGKLTNQMDVSTCIITSRL